MTHPHSSQFARRRFHLSSHVASDRMRPIPRKTVRVGASLVAALRPLCLPLRSCAYPSCPAFLPPFRLQTIPGITHTVPVGAPLVDVLTPLRVLTPNLDCVPYARENTSNAPNPPSDRTRRGAPCGCPSAIVPTLALLGIPFMSSLSAPFSPADHTWRHPDRTRRGAPCGCPSAIVPTLALLGIPFMSSLSAPSRLQTIPGVTPTEPVGAPLVGALALLRVLFSAADHTWRHPDRTLRGAPCGCPFAVARAHPHFGLHPT